jgi:predicted MFS family arabinose efflux permease
MMSAIGTGIGSVLAPILRRRTREEWILAGALVAPGIPLVFAARSYGRPALVVAAVAIAASAATGRLAFDSLLQRDGPEQARGRAFARFETRFQLAWVLGGLLAVVLPSNGRFGIFLIALVLLFAGLWYVGAVRRPSPDVNQPTTGEAPE